jgi:hypothetical protein
MRKITNKKEGQEWEMTEEEQRTLRYIVSHKIGLKEMLKGLEDRFTELDDAQREWWDSFFNSRGLKQSDYAGGLTGDYSTRKVIFKAKK